MMYMIVKKLMDIKRKIPVIYTSFGQYNCLIKIHFLTDIICFSQRKNALCIKDLTENDYMPTKVMVAPSGAFSTARCFTPTVRDC